MIDKARITFDTNVPIYAAIADASPRHQIAERLLARAAQVNCVLVLQSLAEFVWVSTRKAYLSMDAAATMVGTWLDIYPSVQATPERRCARLWWQSGGIIWDSGIRCCGRSRARLAAATS